MEEIVTVESGTQTVQGLPSGAGPDVPSGDQQRLADEIRRLWAAHVEAKAAARKAKAELRDIRRRLAGPLAEMKMLLARPGRNGGWSSFLRSEGIAKATADRLARKREESGSTQPEGMPVPSPSISEPSGASASPSCVAYEAADAPGPVPLAPEGGGANQPDAPAADPVPQPSGEIPAAIEVPVAEAAATPVAAEQAAAVADVGNGGTA
jgi:hypothetical protein